MKVKLFASSSRWITSRVVRVLVTLCRIILHSRMTFQVWLTTFVAIWSVINWRINMEKAHFTNLPAAATGCSTACSQLCHVSASNFTTQDHLSLTRSSRIWTWTDSDNSVTIMRSSIIKYQTQEGWWMDPRASPVYCQWAWQDWYSSSPDLFPIVFDRDFRKPKKMRVWNEMSGKYYGTNSAATQNWLSQEHDPVMLTYWYPGVLYSLAVPMILGALVMVASPAWYFVMMRNRRPGTLGFLLRLELLADIKWRRIVDSLYMGLGFIFTIIGILALMIVPRLPLTPSLASRAYFGAILTWFRMMTGIYSLVTTNTPISMALLEVAPEKLKLPWHWYEPTSVALARLFPAMLLPMQQLTEIRSGKNWRRYEQHIDSSLIRSMTDAELLAVKGMWLHELTTDDASVSVTHDTSRRASGSASAVRVVREAKVKKQIKPMPWYMDAIYRCINVLFGMKEYWLLWTSVLHSSIALSGILARDLSYVKQACSCTSSTRLFEAVLSQSMAREQRNELIQWIMLGMLFVLAGTCVIFKFYLDIRKGAGAPYASLEYVLRMELDKHSRANMALKWISFSCSILVTLPLLIAAFSKTLRYGHPDESLRFFLDLGLQLITSAILFAETGLLTPESILDVPTVHVPMRVWHPTASVLSRLLKFSFLSELEIECLPHNLHHLRHKNISERYARLMSPESLLLVKLHLRREPALKLIKKKAADRRKQMAMLARGVGRVAVEEEEEEEDVQVDDQGVEMQRNPLQNASVVESSSGSSSQESGTSVTGANRSVTGMSRMTEVDSSSSGSGSEYSESQMTLRREPSVDAPVSLS